MAVLKEDTVCFRVLCTEDKGGSFYTVSTKGGLGRVFFDGYGYKYNQNVPQYIAVQNVSGLWTLYNKEGWPMKGAKDVPFVEWDKVSYRVFQSRKSPEEMGKTYFFRRVEIEQRLFMLGIGVMIVAMASVGMYQFNKNNQKQAEYEQKTQMTYLGISNGVALFDTDGDQQTVEIVSPHLSNHHTARLYRREGQTHSIAKWREMIWLSGFTHVR